MLKTFYSKALHLLKKALELLKTQYIPAEQINISSDLEDDHFITARAGSGVY